MNTNAPAATPSAGSGRKKALRVASAICLVSLGLGLLVHNPTHFGFDGFFGFHALLGFGAGAALVLLAGLGGVFLGRDEDYYDR